MLSLPTGAHAAPRVYLKPRSRRVGIIPRYTLADSSFGETGGPRTFPLFLSPLLPFFAHIHTSAIYKCCTREASSATVAECRFLYLLLSFSVSLSPLVSTLARVRASAVLFSYTRLAISLFRMRGTERKRKHGRRPQHEAAQHRGSR